MAKKAGGVDVVLSCIYSGLEDSPGPGDTITVDAAEAERLVSLGVARLADVLVLAAEPAADPVADAPIEADGDEPVEA